MSDKVGFLGLSTLLDRLRGAGVLGDSYDGDRNIYEQCGWKKVLDFTDYKDIYDRDGIGFRIVDAFPRACWSEKPSFANSSDELDEKWDEVLGFNERGLLHYLYRADSMAGVGSYGVLFLGFDDGLSVDKPVGRATKLLFARPYFECDAQISEFERDPGNPRYGLPKLYTLHPASSESASGSTSAPTGPDLRVHHSRILHMAEGCLSSDVFGTPRLKRVINRIWDMQKVLGGSAEGFWRTGFPGLALNLDKDVTLTESQKEDMNDEAEEFIHGLTRLLRLQGMEPQELSADPSDPSNHMDIQLEQVSIATGIPIRILKGSERGELASSQDVRQWQDRVTERREVYANPVVLRPLVNKFMDVGILPKEDSEIVWSLPESTDREKARIAREWSSALSAYSAQNSEARNVIPPKEYLMELWKMSEERADEIISAVEAYKEKQDAEDLERRKKILEMEQEARPEPADEGGDVVEKDEDKGPAGNIARAPDGKSKSFEKETVKND